MYAALLLLNKNKTRMMINGGVKATGGVRGTKK